MDWITIPRIIEGVFMSAFLKGRARPLIVSWAPEGVYIPLRCKKCGAVFITTNSGKIERSSIKYGDDYDRCKKCDEAGHGHDLLEPNMVLYARGRWQ